MPKPPTPTQVIAITVRKIRQHRGWSVREFAERCQEAGFTTLTQSALTNLERGLSTGDPNKRGGRPVTVDELIGLAWVLNVSPIDLMMTGSTEPELQVVPQKSVHPYVAAAWFGAEPLAAPEAWGPPLTTRTTANSPHWAYSRFDLGYRHLVQTRQKLSELDPDDQDRDRAQLAFENALNGMALVLETAVLIGVALPPVPRWMRDELVNAERAGTLFQPAQAGLLDSAIGAERRIKLPDIEVQPDE